MDSTQKPNEPTSSEIVAHQLGLLTGTMREMHTGMTMRLDDIRTDMQRLENSQRTGMEAIEQRLTHRIDGLERNIGRRIDGLENRVGKLEEEDKNFLKVSSKAGGVSGGVTAAIVSGGLEIIKQVAGRF